MYRHQRPAPGARFTKYLTTILQSCQSYDQLMTDVKLSKHLTLNRKLFTGKVHAPNRNIVGDSVRKSAYNIPERNFSTFNSLSYVDLMINLR